MSNSRILIVLVLLALLVVGALTFWSGVATSALSSAHQTTAGIGDHSYDNIENLRADRNSYAVEDHSYDAIEHIRSTRGQASLVNREDHSYDDIERIRSTRGSLGGR